MMEIREIIGSFIVLAGSFFLFTASLGLIRMPDFFNRIQAGTKASTLGSLLILAGVAVLNPVWWPKLLIIFIFIVITNPVSSHCIGRAGYHSNCEKGKLNRDDLKNLKINKGE
ncbi:MAG TPA: monovalent cation/H(+) antiporter subunit G [bacterium]|nr:monovalent cation/H(+) antiporter subunit G [bacterium]